MPRARALVASLVLTALTTACGGSDGTPGASPTPSAMTKAEWVAAVNAICVDLEKETDAIEEPKDVAGFQAALTELVTAFENAQAKVRALRPPAEDAAAIEANFLAPNDAQAAALKAAIPDVQAAVEENDPAAAAKAFGEAFSEVGESAEAQEKWTKDYGLTDCSA